MSATMHLSPRKLLPRKSGQLYRTFTTSQVARDASQSFALPTARLRALISLYHSSSSFITPTNLSERIDRAFTDPQNSITLTMNEYSLAQIQQRLKAKRNENSVDPGTTQYRGVPFDYGGQTWSDRRGMRQTYVANALWGVETGGKPALETVLETSKADETLNNLLAETDNQRQT